MSEDQEDDKPESGALLDTVSIAELAPSDLSDPRIVLQLFEARQRLSSAPTISTHELTPSPMVLATGAASAPGVRPSATDEIRDSLNPLSISAYHPPKTPPGLEAVPTLERTSVRVAAEYDPKAPTRRRLRRPSTHPPPTMSAERWLVQGILLGGLFVAVVIVLAHQISQRVNWSPANDSLVARGGNAASAPSPIGRPSRLVHHRSPRVREGLLERVVGQAGPRRGASPAEAGDMAIADNQALAVDGGTTGPRAGTAVRPVDPTHNAKPRGSPGTKRLWLE